MKHWQKLLLSGLLCALVGAAGCVDDQPADVTPVDCTQDADCAAQEQCLQGLCEPTSQQDMGMDSILTPDTGGQDTGADLGADLPGPEDMPSRGQVGDPCDDGEDCESDYCIEAAGEGRRVCTGFCNPQDAQGCPEGYVCASVQNSGADEVFLCFPRVEILCRACEADADCGGLSDLCLDYPDGSFCGRSCALQGCPEGYSCVDIEGADGSLHSQCRADAGFCSACFDEDGDGYGTGTDCAGLDCNDQDPRVHQFATELCNNLDDDCDDQIDEDFDLQSDAQHCGACDNACAFPNASALCQGGQCVMGGCDEGRFDLDGDPANGCEYACQGSPDSPEQCDGRDNNCDGRIDEGNPEGGAACDTGQEGRCGVGVIRCMQSDLICVAEQDAISEICNGVDDNCDGRVDEGNPEGGDRCDTGQPGVCAAGSLRCQDGAVACQPEATPTQEACDGLDNDCDGAADEDFDLQSDAQHCGACDNACAFPHASALCQGGQCVMGGCDAGRFDLDGDPANGCEYTCQGSPDSPEVCDGIDNDCDGQVDEGNPGGGGGCDTGLPGVCGVGRLQCEGGALACQQQVQPSAEACDGLDNNCDGATDEGNPDGGAACATGQPGVCELGTQVCSGGALACQPNRSPSAELCNGVDDNCDGAVDDAPQGVGVACNTGQAGRCAAGTQLCSGGALACQRNQDPIVELCNGVDDNCDGAADEGNPGGGQACTTGQPGVCGPGTTACSGGAVVCNRNQEPGADTCNGLDDDCDGRADNRCPNGVSNNNNSRNLPSYGGSGGTAFTRLCGAGQMLVGVRVNSGSEVDGMAPICQQLTMSTNRGSSPFSYASAGTGAQSTGAGAGGNGGTAVSYVCPEGSFVHGFQLRTGARVDRLLVQCARASYAQGGGISLTDTDSRAFGGNGGTLRPLHRCNSNEFAAGFYGRAGSRLDNLGFACRSYTVQLNP